MARSPSSLIVLLQSRSGPFAGRVIPGIFPSSMEESAMDRTLLALAAAALAGLLAGSTALAGSDYMRGWRR